MNPFVLVTTLFFLLCSVVSFKAIVYLGANEGPKCFYQYLKNGEKYQFLADGRGHQRYRMDISRQEGHKWYTVYSKTTSNTLSINKLAEAQATHMFCLSNTQDGLLKASITILNGLKLGQTNQLPSSTDSEYLNQQISWLDHKKQQLTETITRNDAGREAAESLKRSSGRTLLVMAFLGLVGIVGINYLFYRKARSTLRQRKLI